MPAGRLLERFHVDSVDGMVVGQSTPNLFVRIDNLIRYDLKTEENAPAGPLTAKPTMPMLCSRSAVGC
jgi:hypothetical protein